MPEYKPSGIVVFSYWDSYSFTMAVYSGHAVQSKPGFFKGFVKADFSMPVQGSALLMLYS